VAVNAENIPILKKLGQIRLRIMIKESETTIFGHKKNPAKEAQNKQEKMRLVAQYNTILQSLSHQLLREFFEYSNKFENKLYPSTVHTLYTSIKEKNSVLKNAFIYESIPGLTPTNKKLALIRSYLEYFAYQNSIGRVKSIYKNSLIKECRKYEIDPQIWLDCEN
jgi:hypothetical protein